MSLANEIIRGFFVAFGSAQTILNARYLIKPDGIESARKQHRELPKNASATQMRAKVICMLVAGVFFLGAGLVSYFTRSYIKPGFILAASGFSVYTLIEAIYYKFWRTTGAFIISAAVTTAVVLI